MSIDAWHRHDTQRRAAFADPRAPLIKHLHLRSPEPGQVEVVVTHGAGSFVGRLDHDQLKLLATQSVDALIKWA
jgi:hypothetical protein